LLALGLSISACRPPPANTVVSKEMHQVRDALGRTVSVPVTIARAVSLAPSVTESVFAVGAGDRLVGVTTFCNYPEEARSIAKVGDTMNPNMESIIALKPDVVFVSTASQIEAFTNTLEANSIAVYVTDAGTPGQVMGELVKLGGLFGTSEQANRLVESLHARIQSVGDKLRFAPLLRTFVQISKEPLFTVGRMSFVTKLVEMGGGESVTANIETAYPKLSKETALTKNPEAIILSESEDNELPNEIFNNSPAVKNGRVYKIDADILSRPGPRLVDALEQLARDLHPDKF